MSRRDIVRMLPSLVIAAVAATYVVLAHRYDLASRALPWMAGMLALLLSLIDATLTGRNDSTRLRADEARGSGALSTAQQSPAHEAIAFVWIGAFLPLVAILGFYASTLLYVFCYLRVYARKAAGVSIATACGVAAFLYLVFDGFMGYEIFGGLLAGDSL